MSGRTCWFKLVLSLSVAAVSAGGSSALLLSPSVDYRVDAGANLGDARDNDADDSTFSGFGSHQADAMASVPGGITTQSSADFTVSATRFSGDLSAMFNSSGGTGGTNARVELLFRLDQPAYMSWSGVGASTTPPGGAAVFFGTRFPSTIIENQNGLSLNLAALSTNPRQLEAGFYRLQLRVGSGTQLSGGTLIATSGQTTMDFAIDFATILPGDTDGDGDVDDADLGAAFARYTGPIATASVPEPASATLLAVGGLCLRRRRR